MKNTNVLKVKINDELVNVLRWQKLPMLRETLANE
jgi:hypothetical protein